MPADYSQRISRLFAMVTLCQAASDWTSQRFAARFGVAERTIFRDLKILRDIGVPIEHDEALGGYCIRRDFFLPPINLDLQEALALATLCGTMADEARPGIPFLSEARPALEKILAKLPPRVRDALIEQNGAPQIDVHLGPMAAGDGFESTFVAVRRALCERRALVCRYEKAGADTQSDPEEFDFEPYAVWFSVRTWYVVGLHGGRGELRTLRIDRFISAQETSRPIEIPEDFRLSDHLGNAWRMIRGTPEADVVIRFDRTFAETVTATQWHHTQNFTNEPDGGCLMHFRVAGFDEIAWWILSMGPHCEVIEPPELRAFVQDLAARTAALYGADGTGSVTS
jgi:predicted DNA-binding transcriptional regulator YafY